VTVGKLFGNKQAAAGVLEEQLCIPWDAVVSCYSNDCSNCAVAKTVLQPRSCHKCPDAVDE
jgi:hypothetical protein